MILSPCDRKHWHRLPLLLLFALIVGWQPLAWSQVDELPTWAQEEPLMPFREISKDYRNRTWLVRGTILGVTRTEQEVKVTIRIDHVYAGSPVLVGQTFDAHFSLDFSHAQFYDDTYLQSLAPGQGLITSLFWMSWRDPKTHENMGHLDYSRQYGFPLPTLLDKSVPSMAVQKHAQAVEEVYRAKPETRSQKMKEYAQASLPLTTDWAITSIASWSEDEGYDFLKQLSQDPQLSLHELGVLNEALRRSVHGEAWLSSAEHLALIKRLPITPQFTE